MEFSSQNILKVMRDYFGDDERRKNHAQAVFDYAMQIQAEEGGDIEVVEVAAALHDIGIHEAERKYNSAVGSYQEIEGPPIAKELLSAFDIPEEKVNHICKIIANHHSAKDIDTIEFKCIWDADWLVNIPDEFDVTDKVKIKKIVKETFKTKTGRAMAEDKFLKSYDGFKPVS